MDSRNDDLKKRNARLAWIVGAFVLLVFATSVPFWMGIARIIGNE